MKPQPASKKLRGRGAAISPAGRFATTQRDAFDDGWQIHEEESTLKTQVFADETKTILSRNESPDIPFNISVNAYRGCEHGCIYCYARPTHEYLSFGAGTDFDRKLVVKPEAPHLLREAFDGGHARAVLLPPQPPPAEQLALPRRTRRKQGALTPASTTVSTNLTRCLDPGSASNLLLLL